MKASRTALYVTWIVAWILGCEFLSWLNLMADASIFSRLIEALVSCVAAIIMTKFKLIKWIIFIYLVINLIRGFGIAAIFCFLMSVGLYYIAKGGVKKSTTTYTYYRRG